MIELIHGLPKNVVGITTRGRVTREDWDDVLLPAMDEALRRHEKVRLYYEIASRYPGAGWDVLDLATDKLERIAVVSDAAWVKWVANALCFLITSKVRVFSKEEEEESRTWIIGSSDETVDVTGFAVKPTTIADSSSSQDTTSSESSTGSTQIS